MRLKAVEMQGFKSFPDKTKMTFESGVTAIIGPNGSGKSNISDAVRWVLGEMSMKSLRGSKMEDVIFNGAPSRPAANFASVSLYLDSEEEYRASHQMNMEEEPVPVEDKPRLSDAPETVVTRKYYRSGESEYYINRKLTRLRDIYELFYDTGIGREGYSVISQGKIAEVLSQKGDERRSIFEEAAGISRFRYRKTEAERKLEETESNLLRVNDILAEVASRVRPLEKEAENARQYLVLNEEKTGLEITLWLNRLDDLRQKCTMGEDGLRDARAALESAQSLESEKEKELDKQLNESYEISRLISLTEQEKSASERAQAAAEGEKAVCRNDLEHFKQICTESTDAIAEAETRSAATAQIIASLGRTLEDARRETTEVEQTCSEREALWQKSHEAVAQAVMEAEQAEEALAKVRAESAECGRSEAALGAELEAAKRSDSESEERISTGMERLSQLKAEKAVKQAERDEVERTYRETLAKEREVREGIRRDGETETATREETVTLRLKLTAAEQRRENLNRMEQLLEGYSDSVRAVLRDGNTGKIRRADGKQAVLYGPVSNILSSGDEYVVALETALASSVQFVVVGQAEDAKACIRYLKEHRIGRATFLPLETVKGSLCDVRQIRQMEGYLGIASELTRFDEKFRGIVEDLLGRTVIADTLDNASKIASAVGHRLKIVTLDGQVIHPGGSYTGGAAAKKVGVFTRAMDLERLGKEIREWNAKLLELDRKLAHTRKDIADAEALCTELQAMEETQKGDLDALESEIGGLTVRMEEEKSHIDAVVRNRDAGSDGRHALEEKLEAVRAKKATYDSRIAQAEERFRKAREYAEQARSMEAANYEALSQSRIVLISKRSQTDSLSAQQAQQTALLSGTMERLNNLRATLASARNSIAERSSRLAVIEEKILTAGKGVNAAEEKLKVLFGGRDAQEARQNEIRVQHKEAQQKREEAFVRLTNEEANFNRIREEFDHVTAKLWDEYELTYSDAEAKRLPPEKMEKAPSRLASLKAKIRAMGSINVNAVEEYRQVKERYDFLTAQVNDLQKTRRSLDSTIAKLENEMKDNFVFTFQQINDSFAQVFAELFGGGTARIELQDPDAPLECGIDIVLKLPGKSVRSISLLSGGEQSFAAIALYLALQNVNPAPFCIFDEIESALDDVNLVKFAEYIRAHSERTQYIVITHRRGTMERADTLYGVTMRQKGISEYIRLDLAKLEKSIKEYTN